MPDWVQQLIDNFIFAIIIGLVTSAIFFIILSRFKPKIEISPLIAKGTSTKTGESIYRIKVINKTKDPITDIKAQLHIFKNHQTATGEIWKSDAITLKRSDPISIDQFDLNDKDSNYAYRFVTYDNLDELWNDDTVQFLRFRIYARHATSGFGAFFKQDYRLKRNVIAQGGFSKGNTFGVV